MSILKELSKKLGGYQIRGNSEYGFECPKCSEGKGKNHLGVNLRKMVYNCFRCKYSGHLSEILSHDMIRKFKDSMVREARNKINKSTKIPDFCSS